MLKQSPIQIVAQRAHDERCLPCLTVKSSNDSLCCTKNHKSKCFIDKFLFHSNCSTFQTFQSTMTCLNMSCSLLNLMGGEDLFQRCARKSREAQMQFQHDAMDRLVINCVDCEFDMFEQTRPSDPHMRSCNHHKCDHTNFLQSIQASELQFFLFL